jgi:type II secretory pathway pseudopilin PulG
MKRKPAPLGKKKITLLEVILVLTLLSVLLGGIAINVRNLLVEERFKSDVATVVSLLNTAQDLMLIQNTEVKVIFKGDQNKGIEISLEVEALLNKGWEKELKRKRNLLKTVHSVNFEDLLDQPKDEEGTLSIKFLSGGSLMSRGVLRLSTSETLKDKNALFAAICLKGYPHPIKAVFENKEGVLCLDKSQEEFDEKLTLETKNSIKVIKVELDGGDDS